MVNWLAIGATIFPNIGGWAGGLITSKNIKPWYESLNKPSWRPPNWAFGPIWTGLYCGMGYASYLVYRDGGGFDGKARLPLILFGTQLALNWAWTPIFFGWHKLGLALVEIVALWAAVLGTGISFWNVNRVAGGIMLAPYLAWLTIATAMSYVIWRDNVIPENDKKST